MSSGASGDRPSSAPPVGPASDEATVILPEGAPAREGVASTPVAPAAGPPVVAAPAADALLGRTVLGHYLVEKKLGQGGMGCVYLVRHTELPDTLAALKVLTAGEGNEQVRARFRQEAKVAAAVGSHRV